MSAFSHTIKFMSKSSCCPDASGVSDFIPNLFRKSNINSTYTLKLDL
jgi:formate hydrogenlyase subunit 4